MMRYFVTDRDNGQIVFESNLPPSMWNSPRPRRTPRKRSYARKGMWSRNDRELAFVGALVASTLATLVALSI